MKDHLRTATNIADLLDNKFKLLGFKFGFDPLLGLIPGSGDLVSLLLSSYIIWIGYNSKLPQEKIFEMVKNSALDFIVGLIPFVGNIADFAYKSNIKNLEIIRKYIEGDVIEGEIVE